MSGVSLVPIQGAYRLPSAPQVLNNMELTTLMFQYLKEMTLPGVESVDPVSGMPVRPSSWTQQFARLALVNHAFFHASIGVLWENMDSVKPFFEILLREGTSVENNEVETPLSIQTTEKWERFKVYSSRTKNLSLRRSTSLALEYHWALFLSTDRKQPDPLFPSLKRVYLSSDDNLSLLVAYTTAPQLEALTIEFDEHCKTILESTSALAKLLSDRARKLRSLTLKNPANTRTISRVCQVDTLTSLYLSITEGSREMLAKINDLTRLERLEIAQTLVPSQPSPFPSVGNMHQHISRPTKFANLKTLIVEANASMQHLVASTLSPHSLKILDLRILADKPDKQMIVIPHVLTIYAKRNLGLSVLSVSCKERNDIDSDAIVHLRGDLEFNKTQLLMSSISALHNLSVLNIRDVPFLAVDILLRLLTTIQSLPNLQKLILDPKAMTNLEADEIMIPPLQCLENISRHNRRLVHCTLPFNISEPAPEIPKDYVSTNRLALLNPFFPVYEEDLLEYTTERKLRMARYLDRLFPYVKDISGRMTKEKPRWELWSEVEKIMFSFQELRAEAIRDLAALPNAMAVDGV
ncbi:hypothetical protein DFP72DRAFT_1043964 [Ephemerocybe angulata]|uniref:Uncharacterized protein n=1 Tax=Ephemerocybe angulata TaxID=980116 RepID=A0A8H6I2Z3_9AGAR|nr:hypothetical protein DFP72DRAFT_1043964 [Tulosesus angulatus]